MPNDTFQRLLRALVLARTGQAGNAVLEGEAAQRRLQEIEQERRFRTVLAQFREGRIDARAAATQEAISGRAGAKQAAEQAAADEERRAALARIQAALSPRAMGKARERGIDTTDPEALEGFQEGRERRRKVREGRAKKRAGAEKAELDRRKAESTISANEALAARRRRPPREDSGETTTGRFTPDQWETMVQERTEILFNGRPESSEVGFKEWSAANPKEAAKLRDQAQRQLMDDIPERQHPLGTERPSGEGLDDLASELGY